MSYRVLMVNDHPMFRMGLAYALRAKGFTVVREAPAWCRRESVDVVLMDVKMPVMDGIEACRAITGLRASPAVVMLTTFEEPAIIEAARAATAVGCLPLRFPGRPAANARCSNCSLGGTATNELQCSLGSALRPPKIT